MGKTRSLLLLIFGVLVPFLVGCQNPSITWTKPGATSQQFYEANSYCKALSLSAAPFDTSYQGPTTTYHSGTIMSSSGGLATYSGTSTNYGNDLESATQNIMRNIDRKNIYQERMFGKGWTARIGDNDPANKPYIIPPDPEGDAAYPKESALPVTLYELPYPGAKQVHRITANQKVFVTNETEDHFEGPFKVAHSVGREKPNSLLFHRQNRL